MADDPAHPEAPDDDDGFRTLVERQLAGPLRESIAQTDLAPRRYLEQAIAKESEIRDEVTAQQAVVDDLERRVLARSRRRIAVSTTAASLLAVVVLGLLDTLSGLPSWLKVATSILVAVAFAIPLLTVVQQFFESWKQRGSAPTSSSTASSLDLDDQLSTAKADLLAALERAIQAWLTDRANLEVGEIYDLSLQKLDPTGLAEVDDGEREIATKNVTDLETTIDLMPGGSIGVSGPRGAGKTTLLKQLTAEARRKRSGRIEVGIVVDAPVQYDAREFVLHLFARLCEDVLGAARVEAMRGWGRRSRLPLAVLPWPLPTLSLPRTPYSPLLGPLVFAVGGVAYLSLEAAAGSPPDPEQFVPWSIALMLIGLALTSITLALLALPSALSRVLGRFGDGSGTTLQAAERHLRQIWYQQTFTSGWSGGLKLPFGLEGGIERGTQLAENQLSYPDVVGLYKQFVRSLSRRRQVRIGIDELDKMDDERARRFLNEIKVIFRVSGCFYLVSVSEDAMAYFERRGLPFRDVFDSSFDDVVRIGYLSYEDSRRVLRRRVVGMPIPFIALCHALGGGLARDVIRAARDVCEESTPPKTDDERREEGEEKGAEKAHAPKTLDDVTKSLCSDELRHKCAAARVAARRLEDPARVTLLSQWLGQVDAASDTIPGLHDKCGRFRQEFVVPLGPSPTADETALREHREALSIALEIVTFAYFTITVRDVMARMLDEESIKRAIEGSAVDGLAQARQAFATNPSEAWLAISAARQETLAGGRIEIPDLSDPPAADTERKEGRGTEPEKKDGEDGSKRKVAGIRQTAGP
jgi:energy-coupling factor transporter ATP-binding protein EcfA2